MAEVCKGDGQCRRGGQGAERLGFRRESLRIMMGEVGREKDKEPSAELLKEWSHREV